MEGRRISRGFRLLRSAYMTEHIPVRVQRLLREARVGRIEGLGDSDKIRHWQKVANERRRERGRKAILIGKLSLLVLSSEVTRAEVRTWLPKAWAYLKPWTVAGRGMPEGIDG